jgi:3-phosphoshikimate 1-carboxyvinyltransferase
MGADVAETPDGAVIRGGSLRGGATVDSRGDHRVAMAMAVAGQCADRALRIGDCANVATSFPAFEALATAAGFDVARATGDR